VAGPEAGPERKWQGLGPALSIAGAATGYVALFSQCDIIIYAYIIHCHYKSIHRLAVKGLISFGKITKPTPVSSDACVFCSRISVVVRSCFYEALNTTEKKMPYLFASPRKSILITI